MNSFPTPVESSVTTRTALRSLLIAAALIATPAVAVPPAAPGHETEGAAMDSSCCAPGAMAPAKTEYARSVVDVPIPDVTLTEASGDAVALREVLEGDGPVMLDFIFTSCTTICPVLSATFAKVDADLGQRGGDLRLVSISIDPQNDTPDRLRAYALRHRADGRWRFFTGTPAAVLVVQRAFGADRGSKFNHAPLTFVRKRGTQQWVRLEGLGDAEGLWTELLRPEVAR